MAALYENVLASWSDLPAAVRRVHEPGESNGLFVVERGSGLLTALIAVVFALPPAAGSVPVRLRVSASEGTQTWERAFDGHVLTSYQRSVARNEILERLGIVECRLAISATDGALVMRSAGAQAGGPQAASRKVSSGSAAPGRWPGRPPSGRG